MCSYWAHVASMSVRCAIALMVLSPLVAIFSAIAIMGRENDTLKGIVAVCAAALVMSAVWVVLCPTGEIVLEWCK